MDCFHQSGSVCFLLANPFLFLNFAKFFLIVFEKVGFSLFYIYIIDFFFPFEELIILSSFKKSLINLLVGYLYAHNPLHNDVKLVALTPNIYSVVHPLAYLKPKEVA